MAPTAWIEFWDTKHSIYVNRRHEAAHFRRIAQDIRAYAPAAGAMIDYGCGEALSADTIAEPLSRLILCEAAPNVRAKLAARYAGNRKIAVRKPEDVAAMQPGSVDLIVMHSVVQYLSTAELDALLAMFRRLLKAGGLLVVGDVIPRELRALDDARELLSFAAKERFEIAAVFGLLRTFFSDYWRLRKSLGLARYDQGEIMAKLQAAGFAADVARSNIGHNAKRMTFLARVR